MRVAKGETSGERGDQGSGQGEWGETWGRGKSKSDSAGRGA